MKCYLFQSKQAWINKSIFFWKWVLFFSACLRGTYKQWATPGECIACPEHSTTDAEGSILKSQCKCHDGYEGDPSRDIACTGNDNSLKKERTRLSLKKKSTDLRSDHYTKVCPIEHSGQTSGTREGISSVPRAPIFRAEFQRKTAVLQSKRKQSKTCLELFKRKQTWTKGKLETFRTQSSFNCEYPVVTILFWASLNKFYAS